MTAPADQGVREQALVTAPADQAVREQALDPQRSFIVQAPAGSGKTELLVQRYLRLLGREQEPDAVLAITFTRKAAAEMRERVSKSLREAASGAPKAPAHQRRSLRLARRVLEQSRRRGWDLPDNPSRLRIITIDALGSWLAVSSPVSSGGGALGNLRADAKPLYEQAAKTLLRDGIRHGKQDVEMLLQHLDGEGQQFAERVAGMLGRREQWLPMLGTEGSTEALNAALRGLVEREAGRMLDSLGPQRSAFESAFATHWSGEGDPDDPARADALAGWRRAAGDLLTKRNQWLVRLRKKLDPELEQALRRSREFRERLARLRILDSPECASERLERAQAVLRILKEAFARLKVLFAQRRETDYTEVSQAALTALGRNDRPSLLAERLDARLRHILVDEFQDTSETQLSLLRQMVGEWQDGDGRTVFLVGDPMQSIYGFRQADVRGFLRACKQGLGPVRPKVLKLTVNFRSTPQLVGWLNGIFPQVFPARPDTHMGAVPYAPCEAAPAPDAAPGDSGAEFHYFRKGDHESEVAIVERIVRETLEERAGKTIGILVRSRTHGEEISHALSRTDIKVSRTEFDRRGRYSVVQDLAAVARALAQPADRIAWLALLRAPWCGLTLADLHLLCHDEPAKTIHELLADPERISRLSADGQARLARVIPVLENAIALKGQLDFRSWVEGTWLALGGPAGNRDENALRHAAEFLHSLAEVSGGSLIDEAVSRTLTLADEFVNNPETGAQVQILTMHKAKGLEFDTVILPGLGRGITGGRPPILRWWRPLGARATHAPQGQDAAVRAQTPGASASHAPQGQEAFASDQGATLLAVPPSRRGNDRDAVFAYLDALAKAREDAERKRLLYVAGTRARSRLHLLIGLARKEETEGPGEFRPTARTMAGDLQEALERLLDEKPPPPLPARRRSARQQRFVNPAIHRVPADWQPPKPPKPMVAPAPEEGGSPSYVWAGERARVLGLTVHRWLQEVAENGPDAYSSEHIEALRPRTRRMLQFHGIPAGELDSLTADVEAALRNTLDDEKGRWTLERHEDAASELPLSLQQEGRTRSLILDRSFVHEGERWIIDYKTSRHEGANLNGFLKEEERRYAPQLERYRLAMQAHDSRPVRTALYFPLHSAFREVTP